jgi:hypothetical protein
VDGVQATLSLAKSLNAYLRQWIEYNLAVGALHLDIANVYPAGEVARGGGVRQSIDVRRVQGRRCLTL